MSRPRPLAVLVSLLCAFLGVAVVATAPLASACSCAQIGLRGLAADSDAVFTATLDRSLEETLSGGEVSSAASVGRVWKGGVGERVTVVTGGQSSACGLTGLEDGDTWLFLGTFDPADRSRVRVSLCGGNRPATDRAARAVDRVLGPADVVPAPAASPASPASPASSPVSSAATEPVTDDGSGSFAPWWWAGGSAALVVLLGVVLAVGRSRPS